MFVCICVGMETLYENIKWRDYYFVLFEGSLFYYKDSKSTTPTGFITLRYASVHLEPKRLAKGEYVFYVVTPLRTIVCKTKHAVALSEWISALENTLNQHMKKKKNSINNNNTMNRKNSLTVLQNINKLIADTSSWNVTQNKHTNNENVENIKLTWKNSILHCSFVHLLIC
jgi:hypothetical protein